MTARIAVPFFALMLCCGSARAQDAATPPPVTAAPITAAPASPAETIAPADAEKVAMATRILEETHTLDNMESFLDIVTPQLLAAVKQQSPGISDEAYNAVAKILPDAMKAELPKLVTMEAQVYAQHFTIDDLKALDSFYQTPAGQKMITEVPKILQETAPLGLAWSREAGVDAMEHVITTLRAQGVKI